MEAGVTAKNTLWCVQATKINWKDDAHNLTKLHPRVKDEDGDDMPAEGGSFFNLFEEAEDPFDVRVFHVRCRTQILDADM